MTEKNPLGIAIKELCLKKGIRQIDLAKTIGMSNTSLSQIVTGKAKPRQANFTKLLETLCESPEDQQRMLSAFGQIEEKVSDEPNKMPWPIPPAELERATRYMEIKSMSVAFQNDVAQALDNAGVQYLRSYRQEPYICDFFLAGPPALAIDCKFNINRDWDRELATVFLLREHLNCERVIITVPYLNDETKQLSEKFESIGGSICPLSELGSAILKLDKAS